MIDLALYLICVGMIVIGALGMIRALSIHGRTRMVMACLAAAVPIGAGVYLFRASNLRVGDLDRLMRAASEEIRQTAESLKGAQSLRGMDEMLEQMRRGGTLPDR